MEQNIGERLNAQFEDAHSPFLVLTVIKSFSNLMKRPGVKIMLAVQVTKSSKKLQEFLFQIKKRVEELTLESKNAKHITKIRHYSCLVQRIRNVCGLIELDQGIDSTCKELEEKCTCIEKETFQHWIAETLDFFKHECNALDIERNLVKIDHSGMLQVNFQKAMRDLIQQVKQFTELGFMISSNVKEKVKIAKGYQKIRMNLKQTAMLYNNIKIKIRPEQKSMIPDTLTALENILAGQRKSRHESINFTQESLSIATCKNKEVCQELSQCLHNASKVLKVETIKLHELHSKMTSLAYSLLSIDIINQKLSWFDHWNTTQSFILSISSKYNGKDVSEWITYWNSQLYKVVEASFQYGLLHFFRNIGTMDCRIIVDEFELKFNSPLNVLRTNVYSKLNAFIEFPLTLFENSRHEENMFTRMLHQNVDLISKVYQLIESIFWRLDSLVCDYSSWSLFSINHILDYIEKCTQFNDFEKNFVAVKAKRQALKLIPDSITIECVVVSLRELKVDLYENIKKIHRMFSAKLNESVETDISKVINYLDSSTCYLQTKPTRFEIILDAQERVTKIKAQKQTMQQLFTEYLKKMDLLVLYALESKTSKIASSNFKIKSKMLSIVSDLLLIRKECFDARLL